ncbi:hypothetical protein SAMN05444410_11749 [Hydrobacter penzbergensis]|jgi:hypothetical protein|uniref:Uncharacterized protein n=1 Tax=Hydrobacter penzbergensis TaxID=1235997 RepID=A0A8X8LGQ6_9BACT|nr:hypothetical protein [Hydrobacter penzbergensis]SDX48569.1 hypothetical protein SAMN05444410_11749 [Hydrobacter penzbergensis]
MRRTLFRFGLLFPVFYSLGCGTSRPTAHIIVNNENAYQQPVYLTVQMSGKAEHSKEVLANATVQPGLQFIPGKKYKKGTYELNIDAHDGTLNVKHPLTLDTDRWIIINYLLSDSSSIVKTYGYLDTTSFKKVKGRYVNLDVYIDNRRPPNL